MYVNIEDIYIKIGQFNDNFISFPSQIMMVYLMYIN